MLFIRFGPRYLYITTHDIKQIESFYTEILDGSILSLEEAFNNANEHCTIIILQEPHKEKPSMTSETLTIFFPHGSSIALSELFNHHHTHLVDSCHLGPGSIFMRVPKGGERLISTIKDTYEAEEVNYYTALLQGDQSDTILSITNHSLHQTLTTSSAISPPLLVHEHVTSLFDKLRKDGLRYITKELEDSQWCELKINIYDSQEDYQKHYDRLIHVLTQLDLGMVLGESWTRDHALSLFSVLAYQVRLFTLYPPLTIKAILKGLEYDDQGSRLVDFDLYYKNKKVSSSQLKTDTDARLKEEKGLYFRQKLMKQLPEDSIQYLHSLETE